MHPNFSVGGEVTGWLGSASGQSLLRLNGTVSVLVFPIPDRHFFFKGGFGGAAFEVSNAAADRYQYGFAAVVGAGIDLPVGPKLFVTPSANVAIQVFDPEPGLERTNHALLFLLGLTWK